MNLFVAKIKFKGHKNQNAPPNQTIVVKAKNMDVAVELSAEFANSKWTKWNMDVQMADNRDGKLIT